MCTGVEGKDSVKDIQVYCWIFIMSNINRIWTLDEFCVDEQCQCVESDRPSISHYEIMTYFVWWHKYHKENNIYFWLWLSIELWLAVVSVDIEYVLCWWKVCVRILIWIYYLILHGNRAYCARQKYHWSMTFTPDYDFLLNLDLL